MSDMRRVKNMLGIVTDPFVHYCEHPASTNKARRHLVWLSVVFLSLTAWTNPESRDLKGGVES
jgi:hypothetical protein